MLSETFPRRCIQATRKVTDKLTVIQRKLADTSFFVCVWCRWSYGCLSQRRCSRWTEISCRNWSSIWSQPTTPRCCPPLRNWPTRSCPPTRRSTRSMVRGQASTFYFMCDCFDLKWKCTKGRSAKPSCIICPFRTHCEHHQCVAVSIKAIVELAQWKFCSSLCSDIFTATGQTLKPSDLKHVACYWLSCVRALITPAKQRGSLQMARLNSSAPTLLWLPSSSGRSMWKKAEHLKKKNNQKSTTVKWRQEREGTDVWKGRGQ